MAWSDCFHDWVCDPWHPIQLLEFRPLSFACVVELNRLTIRHVQKHIYMKYLLAGCIKNAPPMLPRVRVCAFQLFTIHYSL